ncbi:GGDEF domain-containing protein [Pararhizobium gei]|uniref:GGDEF domain-containing protein n=1 Tax=Pararhizobium gei TaxID=1395951 RepID=UPI0023DBD68F|nr:GGDEF domain-containing protein [Rhizobium gei]
MSSPEAIACLSFVVLLPVLLSLRKTGVAGISSFCLASLLSALAALARIADGSAHGAFLETGSTALTIAAGLIILNGLQEFLGQKPLGLRLLLAILSGLLLLLASLLPYAGRTAALEIIDASVGASIYMLAGFTVLHSCAKERAIAPYLLLCSFAAFATTALNIMRIFWIDGHLGILGAVEPRLWETSLLTLRLLAMPLFFLCVVLMLHGRIITGLRHLVAHDDLTGALSRRAFMAEFERIIAANAAAGRQTAFMLLDLDRFKQINDAYGHAGGDVALAHFARVVRSGLAGRGTLGRLGGEEFGIVIAGINRLDATKVAGEICSIVRTMPARTDTHLDIALTVSIGVAMADPTNTPAEIMLQADAALYEAKALGRDRVSIASSFQAPVTGSARALAGAAAQMRAAAGTVLPNRPISRAG